jgi:uncharacterized protein DUF3987/CHC2-type zinc finger protein
LTSAIDVAWEVKLPDDMGGKNDDLAEAKRRLPLRALLHRLGLGQHAKKSSRCPFHDDQRNSFSVWRNEDGQWFWKCHAGYGEGDEITLLRTRKRISNRDAIELLKEMAGVSATVSKPKSCMPPPIDWRACVEAFTNEHIEQLAEWRGLSGEFCSLLKQNQLVGLHEGCIGFPVRDAADNVVAIHYRLSDGSWRYYPPGAKMRPLVIGDLVAGETLHGFESQWDGLDFMDKSGERSGIIISRGAGNGAFVGRLLPEGSKAYLWTQNDAAGEKWQMDICANTKAVVKRVRIPVSHKDLNDWTRAGATADDLYVAMMKAETISAVVTGEPEPAEAEEQLADFPIECLPPILQRVARAISELCGVPLAMSAAMVLAVASASIGKGLRVRSLPGRITSANLFVLVCKTSGSGGSLTYRYATQPLVGMQQTSRRKFQENQKPWIDAERGTVSSQIEALKRKWRRVEPHERTELVQECAELNKQLAKIDKRVSPLLYVTDVTPEKLPEMLCENGETLAHIDSDAADALGIIMGTRYGDGRHTQESLWLKSYTGEPTVIFRKSGNPVHLVAPCLSVLFLATPDKVQELFRTQRLTSGGLLPRFLVCDPRARPMAMNLNEDVKHTLPTDVSQAYEAAIFDALTRYRFFANGNKPEEVESDEIKPYEIEMSAAARKLLIEDWNKFCAKNNGTGDCPFEARHTENAIRISLVLHTFKHVDIEQSGPGTFRATMRAHNHSVDEATVRCALQIRDWFNQHQEILRRPQRAAADDDAWRKAQAMMRDRSRDVGITARDLYNGRHACGNAEEARRLLTQWLAEGRVESFERKPAEGAGRPTTAYRLAPLSRR